MRTALITTHLRLDAGPRRAGWTVRLRARWRAGRHDRDLDRGVTVLPGSALALHAARIVEPAERRRLAAGLRTALVRAGVHNINTSRRVPLQHKAILADSALIDQILQRLDGTGRLRPRGVARLRLLLGDAAGPLYATGRGSLPAQLRGVIAAI